MKKALIIIFILTVAFLYGCAFTRSETKIDYAPNIHAASLASPSVKSLIVAQVKDERGVSDPTIVFYKKNLHGNTTSGCYAADRPITEIFKTGLIQALESRNYKVRPEGADYELRTTIQDFNYEVITGFWKGKLKPKMTVRFEVVDQTSGKEIWRDTLIGRSTVDSGDYVVQSLTLTIDDVISRLLDNKSFQDIFR
jgi:uncharacterized lipoprotein YajG